MNACELTAAITAVAISIANCVSTEELPLVAAIFTQLGDTLATIAVQKELSEPRG